jgi:site-specific DNA recombinase
VRRLGAEGLAVTGERSIIEGETALIRRIFAEFGDGLSPKAIARRLNAEKVPGPRGNAWRSIVIRGHRTRGTGLINNKPSQHLAPAPMITPRFMRGGSTPTAINPPA